MSCVYQKGDETMNNLQLIVKNDTRAAMHMAVELCERGDFDSVAEAVRWLMQERNEVLCESISNIEFKDIPKNPSGYGMKLTSEEIEQAHMAVKLCERGDFDSVNEALEWLRGDAE